MKSNEKVIEVRLQRNTHLRKEPSNNGGEGRKVSLSMLQALLKILRLRVLNLYFHSQHWSILKIKGRRAVKLLRKRALQQTRGERTKLAAGLCHQNERRF